VSIFRASQTEEILKESDHAELVRPAPDRVARAEYTLIFSGRSTAKNRHQGTPYTQIS